MIKLNLTGRLLLCALSCGAGLSAAAQDQPPTTGGGYGYLLDNIDFLLDNYTRFLGRRYDLTEEQESYTHELLRAKAHDYLDQHKPELRELVDRLFEVRTGGAMDQQELIAWGRRALPLYNEAKKLIVEGNAEWRAILTEEQRRIHDEDLRRMHQSFKLTEDQLERIVSGRMTVEEFRNPPRPRRRATRPRREQPRPGTRPQTVNRRERPPAAPPPPRSERSGPLVERPRPLGPKTAAAPPGRSPRPVTPRDKLYRASRGATKAADKGFESKWEAYVREFIKKYKLDKEQQQKARAILKQCQQQGRRYLNARKNVIKKLDARLERLRKSKDKSPELTRLTARRQRLLEPLDRIFERQLKPRLEKLPTSAQRRAARQQAGKKPAHTSGAPKRGSKDDGGGD